MILVIDATATDPDGNVLSGSVAVTVNTPSDGTSAEQAAAPPPAAPLAQRSVMIARGQGWGAR